MFAGGENNDGTLLEDQQAPPPNPYKSLFDQDAVQDKPVPSVNPYKSLFDQDISRQNQQMMQSVSRAAGGDPNAAGEAQRLGDQLGLGQDIVSANLPAARKQAQVQAIEQRQLLLRNPILARQLTDPRFAEIAHDDTANLSATEKAFQWIKGAGRSAWNTLQGLGEAYVYGVPPEEISRQWEAGQLQHEQGLLGYKAAAGEATAEDWGRIDEISRRLDELGPAQGVIGNIVSMGGQMKDMGIGALAAGALTGTAAGAVSGFAGPEAIAPGAIMGFKLGAGFFSSQDIYRMTAGQTYLDMLQKGVHPQSAQYAAVGVGLANTALMQLGLKIGSKPAQQAFNALLGEKIEQALVRPTLGKAAARIAGEWALSSAEGGATFAAQTLVSQMGEDLAKSYDQGQLESALATPQGREELASRVFDSFINGLEMTAVLHGSGSLLKLNVEAERAAEAQRSTQFFASLDKNATESEVRKRNPNAYENFIAAQSNGTGAENIYVDGRQMVDILHQSGLSDEAIDQALPSVRGQLVEAAATSGDVVIPTSEYAKSVAGTPLGQAMLPHMRLSPEADTPAEAIEAAKQREQFIADARKTSAQKMAENEEFAKSARVVEANIYDQLKATKTMPDDLARTNAQLMRDLVVTTAAKLGITPEEFYAKYPLTIGSAGEEGALAQSTAYHGSPYRFSRFSLEHAGAGEGAQAFGHGLYFSSRREIAEYYRQQLASPVEVDGKRPDRFSMGFAESSIMNMFQNRKAAGLSDEVARQQTAAWAKTHPQIGAGHKEFINSLSSGKGQLYKVDIPEDETMLHWDKTLKDQPEAVQKMWADYWQNRPFDGVFKNPDGSLEPDATGKLIYEQLSKEFGSDKAASEKLNSLGITGIKYEDAASRGAPEEEKTHNYVVFDENAVKNLETFYQAAREGTLEQGAVPERGPLSEEEIARNRAEDKAWRNWEPESTSTGTIKGAPDWVKDRKDLNRMRGTLRKLVQEGMVGRFWYENSAQAVMKIVGGDVQKAEKFIQLLAIYSPNSNVWVNTLQAIRAYTHWAMGRPESELDVGTEKLDEKARAVLYHDVPWEGRKTNSFYLNLMHDIVVNHPEEAKNLNLDPAFVNDLAKRATIDVWMGRAFGYDNTGFTNDKGSGKYSFSENEVRRLTAELNSKLQEGEPRWTPHQVQAAIWTAMKTRYEMADVKAKTMEKSRREGLIYDTVKDGKKITEYGKTPAESQQHLANWRQYAMQPTSETVRNVAEEQARSFGDDLRRLTNTVTWEAIPSTDLGHEINGASPEVRRLFTAEAQSLLVGPEGEDLLAHQLGVPLSYSTFGEGAYAGAVSPNVQAHLLPMREKGQEGFNVKEVRDYARAIQYIYQQDAVPWFRHENKPLLAKSALDAQKFRVLRPDGKTAKTFETQEDAEKFAAQKGTGYTVRGGDLARAFVFRFDRPMDNAALQAVLQSLQDYLGKDAGYTRTADNEITVVNFRGDETKVPFARTDEDFVDALEQFAQERGATHGISEHGQTWIQGEYGHVQNWSEDQEGDRVLRTLAESGRSDLQPWLRGRRSAFNALLEKYSGESLARAEDTADTLFQSAPAGGPRGGFNPRRLAITLGQHTDFSTFAHEASHYYLHVLGELAKSDAAEGPFARDMGTLLKWFGVKDLDTWHSMSLEEQRRFHEQFAYSFEKYLAEGKAPSVELQGVFDRFKQWMKRVYASMRDVSAIYKREYGEELPAMTGEVSQVMDRMLASDEQIRQAEAVRNMEPLFGSAEEAGMTPEEFKAYQDLAGLAHDTATNQVDGAQMRDQQWMSNAKGRALKAVQAQHNALRADMREGVAEEVKNTQPVYTAEHFLKTGEIREKGEVTGVAAEHRLDTEAVKALLTREGQPEPDMSRFQGLTKKGGLDPDAAAQMTGFEDGRALVEALRDSRPLKEEVDARTDQAMLEKYGEVSTPEGMARAVEQAVHNDARARLIASELRHALNSTQSERVMVKAAQAAAERLVSQKSLSELDPRAYAAREASAARKAKVAAMRGDKELVIQAKRDQLLQHAMAKAALDVREEAERKLNRLSKYDNPSKAITKAIGADYMDRINELLAGYELGRREPYGETAERQNIDAWVQSEFEKTGVMPAVPDTVTANLGKMHWRDMTIEQLRDLSDAIKSLDYIGRRRGEMEMEGKRVAIDDLIAEVEDALADVPHSAPVDVRADMQYAKGMDKINARWLQFKSAIRSMDSALLKMEQFFQWIDAGSRAGLEEARIEGPMSRVFRMATGAEGQERTMRAESAAAMRALGDKLKASKIRLNEVLSVPELPRAGRGNRWYRGELIAMALNMGNQGNKEKMLLGYQWDEMQAIGAINRLLSPTEMEFVQGVWDHISSYTDRIVELERRQTGVTPRMVEPTPLVTRHGTFKGGYYPVVYDAFQDRSAEQNQARNEAALFENQYNRPATSKGHTIARTGYIGPIWMDLGVITRHLDQVTHDLAWREPISDMNKILSDKRLLDEIDQTYGREYRKQFRPWLQAMANDRVFNTSGDAGWENFYRKARSNATMVGLGFRLSTMMVHGTSALSNSIGEIGSKWFAKGMAQFMGMDRIQETRDFIYERSPEMQHRLETVDRNVQEVINDINRQEASLTAGNALTKTYNQGRRFALYGVSMLDMASAMPTWMGAYLKGIAKASEGGLNLSEADAVEYANRSVRNAHGGGGTKDLSAFQRDKGVMSMFSMFYSFWNHMYNRERDLGKAWKTQFAGKSGTNNLPRLLARSWWYFVVPQLAHALLKPSPQSENDTLEGFAAKTAEEVGLGFVSGVPIFRDLANAAVNGRDYTITPLEQMGKSIVQAFEDTARLVEGEPMHPNAYTNYAQAAGYTFGIPTAQPATTAKFLWDVLSGDADPESVADWYQGIMTGKVKTH